MKDPLEDMVAETLATGKMRTSSAVIDWIKEPDDDNNVKARADWIVKVATKHLANDWGDIDPETWNANNKTLTKADGQIISMYRIPETLGPIENDYGIMVMVITDHDSPGLGLDGLHVLWPSQAVSQMYQRIEREKLFSRDRSNVQRLISIADETSRP